MSTLDLSILGYYGNMAMQHGGPALFKARVFMDPIAFLLTPTLLYL